MKITQKTLRKIIKEELTKVLQESSAVGPEDLPEGIKIMIEQIEEDEILISYVNEYSENSYSYSPYGRMQIDTEVQLNSQFPCLNAMMVAYVKAEKNYGPLLYDIAIEVATMKAGGLVSDRTIVSSDAYDVWSHYFQKRSAPECDTPATKSYYKKIEKECPTGTKELSYVQLDDGDGTLTPKISSDDCLQTISHEYASENDTTWMDEPLSKLYRKKPTTIKALGDKLILKDISLKIT